MPLSLNTLILSAYLLWFLILTLLFLRFYFYTKIIKNGKKETIMSILDGMTKKQNILEEKLTETDKKTNKLMQDGLLHIQKVGLIRFNPFKDTGGDQSFILALLDAQSTGVVISSLHTRNGTRWYAKRVVNGKGIEYDLSEEEEKTIKESKSLLKV